MEVFVPLFFAQPDYDNMQAKIAVSNFQLAVIYNTNAMAPDDTIEKFIDEQTKLDEARVMMFNRYTGSLLRKPR